MNIKKNILIDLFAYFKNLGSFEYYRLFLEDILNLLDRRVLSAQRKHKRIEFFLRWKIFQNIILILFYSRLNDSLRIMMFEYSYYTSDVYRLIFWNSFTLQAILFYICDFFDFFWFFSKQRLLSWAFYLTSDQCVSFKPGS